MAPKQQCVAGCVSCYGAASVLNTNHGGMIMGDKGGKKDKDKSKKQKDKKDVDKARKVQDRIPAKRP